MDGFPGRERTKRQLVGPTGRCAVPLTFGLGIKRLRAWVRRRAGFINLRFQISRFLNQDGSKLWIGGFPGELEQRRRLTHEILPA